MVQRGSQLIELGSSVAHVGKNSVVGGFLCVHIHRHDAINFIIQIPYLNGRVQFASLSERMHTCTHTTSTVRIGISCMYVHTHPGLCLSSSFPLSFPSKRKEGVHFKDAQVRKLS